MGANVIKLKKKFCGRKIIVLFFACDEPETCNSHLKKVPQISGDHFQNMSRGVKENVWQPTMKPLEYAPVL